MKEASSKSGSQSNVVESSLPYKSVRLTKKICNDMSTFKGTRKRLTELQQKINEKHSKIRSGEEKLEVNEELRQIYAEFFENTKKEQDLIIVILAQLSLLVEKAEEKQKESGVFTQQAIATDTTPQADSLAAEGASNVAVPSQPQQPTTPQATAVSTDAMQVDEEDEEMATAPSGSSATANISDSEKQPAGKTTTRTTKKRQTKGTKSTKEPASERTKTEAQPITTDKYLQLDEGIPVKSKVAARISGASEESGDSGFWILASILKYYPDKNRYDVIDEDNSDDESSTSERKTYKLNKNHIVQLPTDFSQHKPFKKGEQVFAVFPDTTTFYPAIVDTAPTKNSKNYYLKFEDDEEDGKTPLRKVSFKYVMPLPK
ncbi:hypothetical protein C9374_001539 [Naegleria lovaniensis]|uniref:SGF29 C-terminal domain-containing protein n=1 Tax=Naegleria lovaniensis TaxID=51637 RepID=A0AA88KRB9_NAELO|nr:uncharacterized protein C9374_001539 [Naegleria lovaniensis]KAG2387207.1 hypothetical protein C9374_001539 [Naegleria lovaniensis]